MKTVRTTTEIKIGDNGSSSNIINFFKKSNVNHIRHCIYIDKLNNLLFEET